MDANAVGAVGAVGSVGSMRAAGALDGLSALGADRIPGATMAGGVGATGTLGTLGTPEAMRAFGADMAEGPPAVSGVRNDVLGGFGALISDGLAQVNARLNAADASLQGLALGDAGSLHEVMIRIEESDIAMRFLMQVRSRLLEAYQDVMRMQL